MRLTIVNQFYPPELAPTGHLAASLAEHRAAQGDEVTVVASRGGYVPASADQRRSTAENPRVVCIWTPRLGKATILRRCLDYTTFYALAAWTLLTLPRQDVIVALTTPPYIAWTAVLHKLLHRRTRIILWNMDCYPELAERSGAMKPGGLLSHIMRTMNRALFRRLDHLVCLDTAMVRLLHSSYAAGNQPPSTTVIPNWEKASFAATSGDEPWLEDPSLDLTGQFVVLYTGNMGHGHRFRAVIEAAERLRKEPVLFLFNGDGVQANVIREAARRRNLANVVVQGYGPIGRVRALMAAADCCLITLRNEILGVMSPSKLHGNLAMGIPIVYVGPEGSNVDDAIRRFGCGVSLRSGDSAGLIDFIRNALRNPDDLRKLVRRAREAFQCEYCDDRALPRFDTVIDPCPIGHRAPEPATSQTKAA